ncbi:MAG TPA: hypothetical protein VGE80_08605 [Schlesneria sp.]
MPTEIRGVVAVSMVKNLRLVACRGTSWDTPLPENEPWHGASTRTFPLNFSN